MAPNQPVVVREFSDASPLVPLQDLVTALDYHLAGQLDRAEAAYDKILQIKPDHPVALHHLGLLALQRGEMRKAADRIDEALAAKPDYAEAHSNRAAVLRALGRLDEAIAAAETAIALKPDYIEAHSNLGSVLEDRGRFDEALAAYRKAYALNENFVKAPANLANLLRRMGRFDEAMTACDEIIAKRPDAPEPYFSLGNLLKDLLRFPDAVAAYREAVKRRPDFAEVYVNLGTTLQQLGRYEEAVDAYRDALRLNPSLPEAHANLGAAHETLGQVAEAIEHYRKAVALNPALTGIRLSLLHQRRYACDWAGLEDEERVLLDDLRQTPQVVPPFALTSMAAEPALQQRLCRAWAATFVPRTPFSHEARAVAAKPRLRIGYLSADFNRHATALLMAELIEQHDRERFEIIGYSYSHDDASALRVRLVEGFDRFVDIAALDHRDAAHRIHDDGVDILVELKGYTQHARTEIAAYRPAPVQVSFLGFPGTMGTDFIDYIIADPFVLPMDQQPHYDEKIVHLPECYQPNDSRRRVADRTPTRAECGLPEDGFVFCCFNNTYKLTPALFTIWMRLLEAVPGSVLWLFSANGFVEDNLRREAAARGVDPARLVFAPRLEVSEHLARQRLADLFLDTLPYNAHTTTSDALWVGLPVVTCAGDTFPGRVAGSLLTAAGMSELVTTTLADYEALALALARDPERLAGLRRRLLATRLTTPLFDGRRFARHLEAAFIRMAEIFAAGEAPQPFAVDPAAAQKPAAPPIEHHRIAFEACPVCDGRNAPATLGADVSRHRFFRPGLPPTVAWHECGDCGHVFTQGYFTPAVEKSFASPEPHERFGTDMESRRPAAARLVEQVMRHVERAQGAWLDVGIGDGSLLFAAQEWGFEPVGTSEDAGAVQGLLSLGGEAYEGRPDSLNTDGRFSVVSLLGRLPREPFPRRLLVTARRLLRPGGALLLTMPNTDTMVWRLLHANNANPLWGAIDQYHQFSRRGLYKLLVKNGFEPRAYQASETMRCGMDVVAVKVR